MTSAARDISVVMCAYTEDRWEIMTAGLEALRRQTLQPREVVVVVDHNPTLLARVKERFPDVVAIENAEPRGLSGARNSGIAVAQGAVIAFIDEDAVAAPDWLERLSAGYTGPEVLGVGGAIRPMWASGTPGWFPAEFNWVVGCTYRGMPESTSPVRNMIGCNMSFRREVFDKVGGFRSGIGRVGTRPVGCEETELCIRVNQQWPGSTLLYEPRAYVDHLVPTSRARWHYFRSRCYAEGISKALVARFVGAKDGLSSERTYTLRTLPQGALRGVGDALRGDVAGLGRAAAIVTGLAYTASGYLAGRIAERREARAQATYEGGAVQGGPA